MYVNFLWISLLLFFWVQRVYWCADCVCYFIAFAITPCYFVVAVVVFTLCVFCVSNASSRLDEKICQKTAQNMRSFCSFFCRSEWLFVCACVWMSVQVNIGYTNWFIASWVLLFSYNKKSYKQNYKSRQKANDLCWQRQRSWRRRKCGQAAVFVSLCVCVCECAKQKAKLKKPSPICACVCVCVFICCCCCAAWRIAKVKFLLGFLYNLNI